jgi:hypothetical protein
VPSTKWERTGANDFAERFDRVVRHYARGNQLSERIPNGEWPESGRPFEVSEERRPVLHQLVAYRDRRVAQA